MDVWGGREILSTPLSPAYDLPPPKEAAPLTHQSNSKRLYRVHQLTVLLGTAPRIALGERWGQRCPLGPHLLKLKGDHHVRPAAAGVEVGRSCGPHFRSLFHQPFNLCIVLARHCLQTIHVEAQLRILPYPQSSGLLASRQQIPHLGGGKDSSMSPPGRRGLLFTLPLELC